MSALDFISILLILSVGQCLFLLFIIVSNKNRSKVANWSLAVLLVAFAWYQLEFLLIRSKLDAEYSFVYGTRYGSWLLVGPLILLYSRASLIGNYKLNWSYIIHFLPFIILTLFLPLIFDGWLTKRSVDYGMLTVFDNWNREPVTWKHYTFGSIFGLQFLHALGYLIFAYYETSSFRKQSFQSNSNINSQLFKTQKFLLSGAAVTIGLCSLFIAYQFFTRDYRRNADYFYVIPMVFIVYGIIYRTIRFPNSVLYLEDIIPKIKYEKSSLPDQVAVEYLKKLEVKVQQDKIYRNSELRLNDLAESLEISRHHLSQVINDKLNQSFFDYINAYRVKEAKKLIIEAENRNMLEIAFAVGFNNKNSFNNAFKKNTGMNPTTYKKEVIQG